MINRLVEGIILRKYINFRKTESVSKSRESELKSEGPEANGGKRPHWCGAGSMKKKRLCLSVSFHPIFSSY